MKPKLIYLATPYSHHDPDVREQRYEQVTKAAADSIATGHYVFSPITHSHPIARVDKLPGDWTFWRGFDARMLAICDELVILCVPGWQESRGVSEERELAATFNIPVSYRDV